MAVTVKVMVAPAGWGGEGVGGESLEGEGEHYADARRGRREIATVGREVDGPDEGPASRRGEPHDRALGRAGSQGEGTAGDDAVGGGGGPGQRAAACFLHGEGPVCEAPHVDGAEVLGAGVTNIAGLITQVKVAGVIPIDHAVIVPISRIIGRTSRFPRPVSRFPRFLAFPHTSTAAKRSSKKSGGPDRIPNGRLSSTVGKW